jgi:succinyl-diaminopimelate desuccinylase
MLETLQELVAIPSINPMGESDAVVSRETQGALDCLLRRAADMGLTARNLDGLVGYVEVGPADARETVGVLAHLDVVPAGEGWTHPPFSGQIADGMIWGRGVEDDKGPAASALYALKALKEAGIPLRRKVRLIAGTHEEGGPWVCVQRYLQSEGSPTLGFTPDGNFPMICGEKGLMSVELCAPAAPEPAQAGFSVVGWWAGTSANIVPSLAWAAIRLQGTSLDEARERIEALRGSASDGPGARVWSPPEFAAPYPQQRAPACDLIVTAEGVEAHGAMPWDGRNAAQELAATVSRLDLTQNGHGRMIRFVAERLGRQWDGAGIGIATQHEKLGPTTANLGVARSEGAAATCVLNIRFTPPLTPAVVTQAVQQAAAEYGLEANAAPVAMAPLFVDEQEELVQALAAAYTETTGLPATCTYTGGTTYAKAFPRTIAFGPLLPDEPMLAHQVDERASVESIIRNAEIFVAALYRLAA